LLPVAIRLHRTVIGRLFVTVDVALGQPPIVTLAPLVVRGQARTKGGKVDEADTPPHCAPIGYRGRAANRGMLEFSPHSHYMGGSP
jgi:hypothetical protein